MKYHDSSYSGTSGCDDDQNYRRRKHLQKQKQNQKRSRTVTVRIIDVLHRMFVSSSLIWGTILFIGPCHARNNLQSSITTVHETLMNDGNVATTTTSTSTTKQVTQQDVQGCQAQIPNYDVNDDGWLQKSEFVQLVRQGLGGCYQDYTIVDGTFYTFACQECRTSTPLESPTNCCVRNDDTQFQYVQQQEQDETTTTTTTTLSFCVVLLRAIEAQCGNDDEQSSSPPSSSTFTPTLSPVLDPSTIPLPTARPTTIVDPSITLTPTLQRPVMDGTSAPTPTNNMPTTIAHPTMTLYPTTTTASHNSSRLQNETLQFNYTLAFAIQNGLTYTNQERQEWLINGFDWLSNETFQSIVASSSPNTSPPPPSPSSTVMSNPGTIRRRQRQIRHLRTATSNNAMLRELQDANNDENGGDDSSSTSNENTTSPIPTIDAQLEFPSQIVQFESLDPFQCKNDDDDDCWTVIHAIDLTGATMDQIQQFQQQMINHIQNGWFLNILQSQFVPNVVIVSQIQREPTSAPTKAPEGSNADNDEDEEGDDEDEDEPAGLRVYAIILIGMAGALAAAILYYWCFHRSTTTKSAPNENDSAVSRGGGRGSTMAESFPSLQGQAGSNNPEGKEQASPPFLTGVAAPKRSSLKKSSFKLSNHEAASNSSVIDVNQNRQQQGDSFISDRPSQPETSSTTPGTMNRASADWEDSNNPQNRQVEDNAATTASISPPPPLGQQSKPSMEWKFETYSASNKGSQSENTSSSKFREGASPARSQTDTLESSRPSDGWSTGSGSSHYKDNSFDSDVFDKHNGTPSMNEMAMPLGNTPPTVQDEILTADSPPRSSKLQSSHNSPSPADSGNAVDSPRAAPTMRDDVPPSSNNGVTWSRPKSSLNNDNSYDSPPSTKTTAAIVASDASVSQTTVPEISTFGSSPKGDNSSSGVVDGTSPISTSATYGVNERTMIFKNSRRSSFKSNLRSSDHGPSGKVSTASTVARALDHIASPKKNRLRLGGLGSSIRKSMTKAAPAPPQIPRHRYRYNGDKEEENMDDEGPIRIGPMESVAMVPTVRPTSAVGRAHALKDESPNAQEVPATPTSPNQSLPSRSTRQKEFRSFVAHQIDATGLVTPISPYADKGDFHVFEDTSDVMDYSESGSSASARHGRRLRLHNRSALGTAERGGKVTNFHEEKIPGEDVKTNKEREAAKIQEKEKLNKAAINDEGRPYTEQEEKGERSQDDTDRPSQIQREATDGAEVTSLSAPEDESFRPRLFVSPLSMTSGASRVVSPVSSDDGPIPAIPEPDAVDNTEPFYGGVYYGEEDKDMEDPPKLSSEAALKDIDLPIDPEVPVYGGVYYGSDEDEKSAFTGSVFGSGASNEQLRQILEEETRHDSKDKRAVREEIEDVISPAMEYFAGISMPRKPSFTSTLTGSYNGSEPSAFLSVSGVAEHMYDGGEDWSLNSRDSRKSSTSMLSVDEREWQRRLRDDLLHPVTEDDVIGDVAIDLGRTNSSNAASGFTGLSGVHRGTGAGSKGSRSKRRFSREG